MRMTYEIAQAVLDMQENAFLHDVKLGGVARQVAWVDLLAEAVKVTGRRPYQWRSIRQDADKKRRVAELEIELSAIENSLEQAMAVKEHESLKSRRAELLNELKGLTDEH